MCCELFEGKEIDFEAMVPEHQKEFAKKFFEDFLTPALGKFTLGRGATPFEGPLTAPAMNPFTQSAMGMMAKSPYGKMGNWGQMPGFGTAMGYPGATDWSTSPDEDYPITIDDPDFRPINGDEDGDDGDGGGKDGDEDEEDKDKVKKVQHGFHGTVTGPKTFQVEPGVRERVDISPMRGQMPGRQRPPTGTGQDLMQLFSLIQRLSQLPQRPPMGQMPGVRQPGMTGGRVGAMQRPRLPFMR